MERVFVIVLDGGLNGAWVHDQAFASEEQAREAAPSLERQWGWANCTGYGGWDIQAVDLPSEHPRR